MEDRIEALKTEFKKYGQEHVFQFWHELSDLEKEFFLNQLESVDVKEIGRLYEASMNESGFLENEIIEAANVVPAFEVETGHLGEVKALGEDALRRGKVAAFVVAGGQGSRLGFEGPKGSFKPGLPSGRSLFQVQADHLIALGHKYGHAIPWYIMTSHTNHDDTVSFFEDNDYFGFPQNDILFFSQEMLPAVDRDGKLILSEKNSLFLSPNGHGGSLLAMQKGGALADMKKRGVEYIGYYQVDNILIQICNPEFIGLHILEESDMSFKMVRKRDAGEKVGVVGIVDNKTKVIEYSDLPEEEANAVGEDGQLKFWSGSIAIHTFSRKFVDDLVAGDFSLPFHKAEKGIPYMDSNGNKVEVEGKNGIKFESFVFDAVEFAKKVSLLEVLREKEFSPVKNKSGEDSPKTAVCDLMEESARALFECGVQIPRNANGSLKFNIELGPQYLLDLDLLKKKIGLNYVVSGDICWI